MSELSSNANNNGQTEKGIEINVSAPGKVILHGEHSVVYGKLAIAASLELRTKVHLVEIDSPNTFILKILPQDFEKSFDLEKLQNMLLDKPPAVTKNISEFNWESPKLVHTPTHLNTLEYAAMTLLSVKNTWYEEMVVRSVRCVFYLLSAIFSSTNVKLKPMSISVDTELDLGAGTGSSASYSVAIAATLIQYLKLKSRDMSNVSRPGFKPCSWDQYDDEKSFSEKELELITDWAYQGEMLFHKNPSGLDNTVCTYGNMVKYRRYQPPPTLIKLTVTFNILLINTKVPRETHELVRSVARLRERFPDLINHILDAMEDLAISAGDTIEKIDNAAIARDDDTVEKLYKDLETLIQKNHSLLNALGVSHEKLEEIITILNKHGLKGKLTGAGGGGFAISILPPSYDPEEVIRILTEHDFRVICTKLGGPGVRVD